MNVIRKDTGIFIIFVLILLTAAILRLDNLDRSTIGHLEIYIPGIPLPPIELSDPPPRMTLIKTITGPVAGEPHPPGFYIGMFFWTKIFGTNAWSLRLPAALMGTGSILLIFILGMLERDKSSALLAAIMLALNGLHIYWSQMARMYPVACFLGLLSTVILLFIVKRRKTAWYWLVLYALTTLAGLAVLAYFWPILLAQSLWVSLQGLTKNRDIPGILRWQILVFILGSPLLVLYAFQSRYRSPTALSNNLVESLAQFMQFGYLLEPAIFVSDPWLEPAPVTWALILIGILLVISIILLAESLRHIWSTSTPPALPTLNSPSLPVLTITALAMLGVDLVFLIFANSKDPSRNIPILLVSGITLLLPGGAFLLTRYWESLFLHFKVLPERLRTLIDRLPVSFFLAFIPSLIIVGANLFSLRASTLYTPYLLVLLAGGLSTLIKRHKIFLVLIPILLAVHILSAIHYKQRLHSPNDYKALAEIWMPEIEETDLIFIQRHWATTPIFYYLRPDSYRFIGYDYAQVLIEYPQARVWVLSLDDLPNPENLDQAIKNYVPASSLTALRIKANLYEPP